MSNSSDNEASQGAPADASISSTSGGLAAAGGGHAHSEAAVEAADADYDVSAAHRPTMRFFLIRTFLHHKIAANLLAITMVVLGMFSLFRMNTQFFPTVEIPGIHVGIPWSGATPKDVEQSILDVVEPDLRFIQGLKELRSSASNGYASIQLEFVDGYNMVQAQADVEQALAQSILPQESEKPILTLFQFSDTVVGLLLTAQDEGVSEIELKAQARKVRDGLLEAGVDEVELGGVRTDEIWVEIDKEQLLALGLTLSDVSRRIAEQNINAPVGNVGGASELGVRVQSQARDAFGIGELDLIASRDGDRVFLRDVARVRNAFDENAVSVLHDGKPTVFLEARRGKNSDVLRTQQIVFDYVEQLEQDQTLPAGFSLVLTDNNAELVQDRVNLLIRNGVGGAVILLVLLFLFLTPRVAFWVAMGVPISLCGGMIGMLVLGQSINMISLFAMILVLGILVDDAIVVGEHSATLYERGMTPMEAASRGATRMALPVTAAVLTTQASFMPLLMIGGVIGQIISAIPILVIVALAASLIESFFVLPAHVQGALAAKERRERAIARGWIKPNKISLAWEKVQGGFNRRFNDFRVGAFRRLVARAYAWRYVTVAISVAMLAISISLTSNGYVKFQFFPQPEAEVINANLVFVPGTHREEVEQGVAEVRAALERINKQLAPSEELGTIIRSTYSRIGATNFRVSDNLAQIVLEITPTDNRTTRTDEIISLWRSAVPPIKGLARLNISGATGGPPGRDIEAAISGAEPAILKQAAQELEAHLRTLPAVFGIRDDMPYGKDELQVTLSPLGEHLGFTSQSLARQLRDAFRGAVAQRIARNTEDVVVRVRLAEETSDVSGLVNFRLRTPAGTTVPFSEVATYQQVPSFSRLRRIDGVNTVRVFGSVRADQANAGELREELQQGIVAEISDRYGVEIKFGGRQEERSETFGDMEFGGVVGLIIIFLVLAWVFEGYSKPLVIMTIIPFGFIGTVLGHMVMGFDLTILSFFGMVGLFGVLVNDSIVLVDRIHEMEKRGLEPEAATIAGTVDRLRAVTITTLTTIGGLTPLLFEQSFQAQFLKPMAVTIVFGLAVASILVVLLVPALLGIREDIARKVAQIWRWLHHGHVEGADAGLAAR